MKKEFIGFYEPTDKEIKESWNNGIFAFDANALLNLYRYTELTRKDFLSALKTIEKKLFLPYQAAFEFHSNRISVIDGLFQSYSELFEIMKVNYENTLKVQLNKFKKHPSIIVDNIFKIYSDLLTNVSKELENQKKKHPDFNTKDDVLNSLTELFENHIGIEFSNKELKKIYLEGKERYDESIPPGFCDMEKKKKKGERHIYGDFIIWKELIDFAKKEKKPLVFVTDDRKEDWWTIEKGKTIRPREELIKEFYDQTGIRVLIYNADSFLHYAKEKKLVPQLKENTIKEVKEVRVSDEKMNLAISNFAKSAGVFSGNLDYKLMAENIARNAAYLGKTNYNSIVENFAIPNNLLGNIDYGSIADSLARTNFIMGNIDYNALSENMARTTGIFSNPNYGSILDNVKRASGTIIFDPASDSNIIELVNSKDQDIITNNSDITNTVNEVKKEPKEKKSE